MVDGMEYNESNSASSSGESEVETSGASREEPVKLQERQAPREERQERQRVKGVVRRR